MLRGIRVSQSLIDLPRLQRGFVAGVSQTHNEFLGSGSHSESVDISLDLKLFAADAVGLVPMKLGASRGAIGQSHLREAFALPPPAATIQLSKARNLSDGTTGREGLDIGDLANDLEVHSSIVSGGRERVNLTYNDCVERAPRSAATRAPGSGADGRSARTRG